MQPYWELLHGHGQMVGVESRERVGACSNRAAQADCLEEVTAHGWEMAGPTGWRAPRPASALRGGSESVKGLQGHCRGQARMSLPSLKAQAWATRGGCPQGPGWATWGWDDFKA